MTASCGLRRRVPPLGTVESTLIDEGNIRGLNEMLRRCLFGKTEGNHEKSYGSLRFDLS
jgi:hypothetical protein